MRSMLDPLKTFMCSPGIAGYMGAANHTPLRKLRQEVSERNGCQQSHVAHVSPVLFSVNIRPMG